MIYTDMGGIWVKLGGYIEGGEVQLLPPQRVDGHQLRRSAGGALRNPYILFTSIWVYLFKINITIIRHW